MTSQEVSVEVTAKENHGHGNHETTVTVVCTLPRLEDKEDLRGIRAALETEFGNRVHISHGNWEYQDRENEVLRIIWNKRANRKDEAVSKAELLGEIMLRYGNLEKKIENIVNTSLKRLELMERAKHILLEVKHISTAHGEESLKEAKAALNFDEQIQTLVQSLREKTLEIFLQKLDDPTSWVYTDKEGNEVGTASPEAQTLTRQNAEEAVESYVKYALPGRPMFFESSNDHKQNTIALLAATLESNDEV